MAHCTLIRTMLILISAAASGAKPDLLTEEIKQIEILEKQGERSKALVAVSRLLEYLRQTDPAYGFLPAAMDRKASLEQDLGRYREAERDYLEAIRLWRSAKTAPSPGLATELNNLASLLSATGRMGEAESLHRESLDLRVRLLGRQSAEVALSYSNLAIDLFRQRRYTEAGGLCHQVLAIWSNNGPEHDRSDLALNTLALIALHDQNSAAALSYALAALAHRRSGGRTDSYSLAGYEHTVAIAREACGQTDVAEQDFRSALALLNNTATSAPSLARIGLLTDYGQLLNQMRRKKDAKRLLRQAELERTALLRVNGWEHTIDVNALLSADNTGRAR
ncbi:MAG: tetratricopeptide repeat protein [Bryobacteraceae bacterium]